MLLRILSRSQLSKTEATSETPSESLGVVEWGWSSCVGEVSGGVVNHGGASWRDVSPCNVECNWSCFTRTISCFCHTICSWCLVSSTSSIRD